MKKPVIITIITVILLVCTMLIHYFVFVNNRANEDVKVDSEIQITEFNVQGRVTLKTDNSIYIGNNLKELENNFYDVKIINTKSGVAVYLNKLWYENYGEDYIQDEYLAKICRELSGKLNQSNETEQFEYILYKYIKDNYVKIRKNESVEKMMTDTFNMSFCLENNVVKLKIQRGS